MCQARDRQSDRAQGNGERQDQGATTQAGQASLAGEMVIPAAHHADFSSGTPLSSPEDSDHPYASKTWVHLRKPHHGPAGNSSLGVPALTYASKL